MPVLAEWNLRITVDQVLRGQGADPDQIRLRNSFLVTLASEALDEGLPLIAPRVLYEQYSVESICHDSLLLHGWGWLKSPFLVKRMAGADKLVVIVCTIGDALDQVASKEVLSKASRGLALHGVGSAAVESLANAACAWIEEQAALEGMASTAPASPGDQDWPIEVGQPQLFSLVDADRIGVRLTSHALMLPRKSLSMVVGFGKAVLQKGIPCDYCTMRDRCQYRGQHD